MAPRDADRPNGADAASQQPAGTQARTTAPFRVGVVDTTFSRVDMGAVAVAELQRLFGNGNVTILRTVVPGIKDLAVACKRLIEEQDCQMVLACGMPGPEAIDKQCAHEASLGIQHAMLATNTHILEVFVHADEVERGDEAGLVRLAENRVRGHAANCHLMLAAPQRMLARAGQGVRQGFEDEGPARRREESRPKA